MVGTLDSWIYSPASPQGGPQNFVHMMTRFAQDSGLTAPNELQQASNPPGLPQIVREATDPKTGQPDFAKVVVGMASDPQLAAFAAPVMRQLVGRAIANPADLSVSLGVAHQTQKLVEQTYSSLLPRRDTMSYGDLIRAAGTFQAEATAAGFWNSKMQDLLIKELVAAPQEGGKPLQEWVTQRTAAAGRTANTLGQLLQQLSPLQ